MNNSVENLDQLLKEVDALQKDIEALRPMRYEDEERLWKKLRLEWNYNSNHIEGNTLTYQETELVLIFDQAPNGSHTVREIEEMKAHDVAVALVRDWANDEKRELSEADIRDLNRILLVRPFWKEALIPDGQPTRRLITVGDYKKHPNSVRLPNGEMFHYASPEETPRKMAALISWYRQVSPEQHPAVVAARLHYDFVRIHPFDDGNGRVSRLLMNYHLLRNGLPPVVIKSVDKKNYLAALQRADVGDFEAFVAYIAEQLLWSLDLSIRAAKGDSVEEMGDWEKELAILERTVSNQPLSSITNGILRERMFDSIIPLIKNVFEKTLKVDSFFRSPQKRILVYYSQQESETSLEDLPKLVQSLYQESKLSTIQLIDILFTWANAKTNSSRSISIEICCRFSPDTYSIDFESEGNKLVNKKLDIPLLVPEIERIVETIGKNLVESLKNEL